MPLAVAFLFLELRFRLLKHFNDSDPLILYTILAGHFIQDSCYDIFLICPSKRAVVVKTQPLAFRLFWLDCSSPSSFPPPSLHSIAIALVPFSFYELDSRGALQR